MKELPVLITLILFFSIQVQADDNNQGMFAVPPSEQSVQATSPTLDAVDSKADVRAPAADSSKVEISAPGIDTINQVSATAANTCAQDADPKECVKRELEAAGYNVQMGDLSPPLATNATVKAAVANFLNCVKNSAGGAGSEATLSACNQKSQDTISAGQSGNGGPKTSY